MNSTLDEQTMAKLRSSLPALTSILHTFASSPSTFKLLTTISSSIPFPPPLSPPNPPSTQPNQPTHSKTLYILDSSFNPPTLAHLSLLTTALSSSTPSPSPSPSPAPRILLLLSTQNADKPPKPASFENRLIMMQLFAQDLLSILPSPSVDIGITKNPYFHKKSSSIEESGIYPADTTQIHLLGYDTLIRLLDTKYYPPSHSLSVLDPFLSKHKIKVFYRPTTSGGKEEREEQDKYLRDLGEGKRENEGGRAEWGKEGRIEMVDGGKGEGISSTRVRGAVKEGDREVLGRLVTEGVMEWVLGEGLYLEE